MKMVNLFIIYGIIIAIITYFIIKIVKYTRLRGLLNKFPGPPDLFFFGNAHNMEVDGHKFYKQLLQISKECSTKGAFRIWFGPLCNVYCHLPSTMEKILTSNKIINKGFLYDFLHPWIGLGLLTLGGSKWQSRRKLLTPAFHFRILNDFSIIMNEQARVLLNVIKEKTHSNPKQALDVYKLMTMCTLDIICETAMGVQLNAQNQSSNYVNSIQNVTESFMKRIKNPLKWPKWMFLLFPEGREFYHHVDQVHRFTNQVIQTRKSLHKQQNAAAGRVGGDHKKRLAFLDLLLEYQQANPQNLTDQDLREEVDTFMFEGHDTTAAGLTWTLLLLAQHVDIQQKVQQELDKVIGDENKFNDDDNAAAITYEQLNQLTYLDKVIKESSRLMPPVPSVSRKCEEDMELDGLIVPKGCDINLFILGLHRNETIYFKPNEFIPERFDLNEEERSPFAFVPFSAGARNCIGSKFAQMEEKIIVAHILREYSLQTNVTIDDCVPAFEVVLRPKKPVPVYFIKRN